MGEKLFYYFEEPNIGGISLLSFRLVFLGYFYFYLEPEPEFRLISFICWAYYFWIGYYYF